MKNKITLGGAILAPLMFALLVSTASAASLYRQLDFGVTGSDVSDLQTFLSLDASIYPEGLVTGYFGPLTRAAVTRFQTKNGIDAVGRVGPITMAAINNQMSGSTSPTSDTTEGAGKVTNTGSVQPVVSNVVVSASSTSALVTWTSSVSATARVMYSTVWPFNYKAAPSVTGTGGATSQSVTLAGLQPNTTYYYVAESLDVAGNFSWSAAGASFRTQP